MSMTVNELLDRIEELKDRVYNLTVYLHYIEDLHIAAFDSMMKEFSGMPGYCPQEVLDDVWNEKEDVQEEIPTGDRTDSREDSEGV